MRTDHRLDSMPDSSDSKRSGDPFCSNKEESGEPTNDGFRTKRLMLDYLDRLLWFAEQGIRIDTDTQTRLKEDLSILMDDVDRVENQKDWKDAMKHRLKRLTDLLDEKVVLK
jgi:hypothetical protein